MSQCLHVVILLFCVGTAIYFIFDNPDIREWTISITMSIGCTLLTVISSGGVIHIQDRQHIIYQRVQQQYKSNRNRKRSQKRERPHSKRTL
eukprot:355706_1